MSLLDLSFASRGDSIAERCPWARGDVEPVQCLAGLVRNLLRQQAQQDFRRDTDDSQVH